MMMSEETIELEEPPSQTTTASPPITRRKWLRRMVAASTGLAGLGLYVRQVEPYWVEIVRQEMPIRDLPAALEGRTLVQISDIHIGDHVHDSFLTSWFQQVSDSQPDLVVFTGDFLTLGRDRSMPIEKLESLLPQFPKGKLGTFGILGNHDHGYHWRDANVAANMTSIAENSGIKVLRNEMEEVSGLQLVGFDDLWGTNYRGPHVLRPVDCSRPSLALCHNPDVADLKVWSNFQGWILAGHTHGGQCKPPFLPPPHLPVHNKRYVAGAFDLGDGRHLYVNRGLGHSIPLRFNVRPEVTMFTLVRSV